MAYTKKVWSDGDIINAANLNNIEDEVDAIADLSYTFAGAKKFTSDIEVEKVDAGIELHDTDGGGKDYLLRSIDGKVQIYEVGVGTALDDILNHGPGAHTDRTHTVFLHGSMMDASYQKATNGNMRGVEMRDAQHDEAWGGFLIKDAELFKLSASRPVYIHLKSTVASSGTVVIDVYIYGIDDSDGSETALLSSTGNTQAFGASISFEVLSVGNVDLSTEYDHYVVKIVRDGDHGSDDYANSILCCGVEIVVESDQ